MSFDNYYPNRKDWRKPYHGCQAFDRSCRPHGGDTYDVGNRLHASQRAECAAEDSLKDYEDELLGIVGNDGEEQPGQGSSPSTDRTVRPDEEAD